MDKYFIAVLVWLLIGSMSTSLAWVYIDIERTPGSRNLNGYVRGFVGGLLAGPIALMYLIYKLIKDCSEGR